MWTQNNYITYKGEGKNFKVKFNWKDLTDIDFHKASVELAKTINETKQGKIYLMYSGGVDSEYILNLFCDLKITITPVIIKLKPSYNEHDIKYAFDYCESRKLKPVIIDIDFDKFVKSGEILEIAESVRCAAYQLPSTYKIVKNLNGTIIMGNHGPPHVTLDPDTKTWRITEHQPLYSVLRLFEKEKLYGYPFFLVYTPEQYYSFLTHPIMTKLTNNQIFGKLGNNSSKYLIYNNFGNYNLVQRTKYTGFEIIEKSPIFQHENLQTIVNWKDKLWGIHYVEYNAFLKSIKKT